MTVVINGKVYSIVCDYTGYTQALLNRKCVASAMDFAALCYNMRRFFK